MWRDSTVPIRKNKIEYMCVCVKGCSFGCWTSFFFTVVVRD